jgi:hypothetical protein
VRRGLIITLPTHVVGLIAALVTLSARQADPAFTYEQQHPARLEPTQLEAILVRTREPLRAGMGTVAVSVRCLPGSNGPKLNPWRCALRYRSGHTIAYRIKVQPSGHFRGVDRTGFRLIGGCCLRGTATPRFPRKILRGTWHGSGDPGRGARRPGSTRSRSSWHATELRASPQSDSISAGCSKRI